MAEDNFYRDFENKHRGSRELIKNRLKVYLSFVKPLAEIYKRDKVFDIGCGRGEWLELMSEIGFEAYGCDIDEGMLEDCYERGLSASKQEAVSFLKSLPDESHALISAFHVIEHIPFDDLRTLVLESLRILKPGGLLILETPNSENINVATNNFYLDPTHKRPIPPLLLSFLTEYCGFKRYKLLRLQESSELADSDRIKLTDIFRGVSPDIAVVAQKNTSIETMDLFNKVFDKNYGLTLDDLAMRYDAIIESRINSVNAIIESRINSVNAIIESRINSVNAIIESRINSVNDNIQSNTLIRAGNFARWFVNGSIAWLTFSPSSRPRRIIKKVLLNLKSKINARPKLKKLLLMLLSPFPKFKERLKKMGCQDAVITNHNESKEISIETPELSPHAQKIYSDLKNAIEERKDKCV
ncbi:MAG: class I SAM-dependent methyltransferase [bacterium]